MERIMNCRCLNCGKDGYLRLDFEDGSVVCTDCDETFDADAIEAQIKALQGVLKVCQLRDTIIAESDATVATN